MEEREGEGKSERKQEKGLSQTREKTDALRAGRQDMRDGTGGARGILYIRNRN